MADNMNLAALQAANLLGSGESILVIDDEQMQRKLLSELLKVLGYQTATVASGEEALTFLDKEAVDLVLLDMCMDPGMNGRQTYESILKIHPGQRAIIISGYSESEEIDRTLKLGAREFVRKPYTIMELGRAVKNGLT